MDEYEVIWSIESIYDAADIEDFIETEFGKDRADRFHNDIDFEVESLGRSYKLYADTGIYYRNFLILKKLFNPSIIFYVVDASEEKVYILRILRHERDWQTMLKETIHYSF